MGIEIQLIHNTQIICIAQTEVGEYRDAAYTPEGQPVDVKELTAEFEGRIGRWVDNIKNPPVMPEPTPEEIQERIDQMAQMIEVYQSQIPELVNLKSMRVEAIAVAEALQVEEKMIEEPIEEVRG